MGSHRVERCGSFLGGKTRSERLKLAQSFSRKLNGRLVFVLEAMRQCVSRQVCG